MKDAVTISLRFNFKKIFHYFKIVTLLATMVFAIYSARQFYYQRILKKAATYLEAGLGTAAAEYFEPYRHHFTNSEVGCRMLVTMYGMSRREDRLQWAVESCRFAKIQVPEMALAMAQLEFLNGRLDAALTYFKQASFEYKLPAGILGAISVLQEQKQDAQAIALIRRGLLDFPKDDEIAILALKILAKVKSPVENRRLAFRLLGYAERTPDVELRTIVAEGLIAGGDPQSGLRLLESIKDGVAGPVKPGPDVHSVPVGSPPPAFTGPALTTASDVPFVVKRPHMANMMAPDGKAALGHAKADAGAKATAKPTHQ